MIRNFFVQAGLATLMASPMLAATLTISPNPVTNTFTGDLQISIGGLTNRETVLLEEFLDANGNGVVNTNEPLVQCFSIIDGVDRTIAGVRNPNVPEDNDGVTNGSITVRLAFAAASEANRLAGSYRFRVSSPANRFPAVEQAFTVTSAAYGQSITGLVYGVSAPLTNASVVLLDLASGDLIAGAVANNAGGFSVPAPAGAYRVIAFQPGGPVAPWTAAPVVQLGPGETKSIRLTNTAAPRTISGYVRDDATAAALAGVQLCLLSADGWATLAFTDATGFFRAAVTASAEWSIDPSQASLRRLGYLGRSPRVTVNTSATNAVQNLALPSATSLFYGTLRNEAGQAVAGALIQADDNDSFLYSGTGFTASNGTYAVGVRASPAWYVQAESAALTRLGFLGLGANVSVLAGQALPVDLQARTINAHIQGRLVRDDGAPVADLRVDASSSEGFFVSSRTGADGVLDLGVFGGDWSINLDLFDVQGRALIQPLLPFVTIADHATRNDANATLQRSSGVISGSVHDTNLMAIGSACVSAQREQGGFTYNVGGSTDDQGHYELAVFNGPWSVAVGDLTFLGYAAPAPQPTTVANSTNVVDFVVQPLGPLQIQTVRVPPAFLDVPYFFQLEAVGGAAPYLWTLLDGSLPGLELGLDGVLSGVPDRLGTNEFTVEVMDNLASSANQTFSIVTTRNPARLLLYTPPSNGQLQLQLSGRQDQSYVLEASVQLAPANWMPVATNTTINGVLDFIDPHATGGTRFYRAREQ